jgi:peptide/nickel transport system ATP-binding protein
MSAVGPSTIEINDLRVAFDGVEVLHGLGVHVARGEAVGFVGESGCGKSVTWLAALGLLPGKATVSGSVRLDGVELIGAPRSRLETVRGGRIAVIFQDPSSSLNPVLSVGRQIGETLKLHRGLSGAAAKAETLRLMEMVGIPDRARRFSQYPHEFSGGQCQRLMIAMALAGEPDFLVADEPTTALDATIEAEILDLLNELRAETGMAVVFISHNLGAVAEIADRVAVMYAGRIVETGTTADLFATPRHPYTAGLIDAIPRLDAPRHRLKPIPGTVPSARTMPAGCAFGPRCPRASDACVREVPAHDRPGAGASVACFSPLASSAVFAPESLYAAE